MSTELIFSCGTGGVGKTTCSAVLGITMAMTGKRVILITIDPARRLADSLRISLTGNDISKVPLPNCTGSLEAMMLDSADIFQRIAQEHSSLKEFERLQQNRYFSFARDKMGGIQEYMAILQVMLLVRKTTYDAIIIDTPPARNAIEFLEAPSRLQNLFSSAGLQWLSSGSGLGSLSIGKTLIAKGLRRFLGIEIISDMAEFFSLFRTVAQQLEKASQECLIIMRSNRTRFWIITTSEQHNSAELLTFIQYLQEKEYPLAGVLLNKYPSALPILTVEQKEQLSTDEILSKTIDWLHEKNRQEYQLASEQSSELEHTGLPIFRLPKRQLHHIDDMVQLAQELREQLSASNE